MRTLDYLENKGIPDLLSLDTTTIFMDSEPIKPEKFSLDPKRNELMDVYHKGLSRLIPDEGIDGKIFRMKVNLKTIKSTDGSYMLPDRYHILKKDATIDYPPAMTANLNIILNFMCNDFIKPVDSMCCRVGSEKHL